MKQAAKYAKDDGGDDDGTDQARARADAGRKCVRSIQNYPVLSAEWISLVDSLHQLARLAQLDKLMPSDAKVAEMKGRDNESEGTLWDQEQQENAVRVLVEEAKVNLCLRIIHEYKRWHYNAAERKTAIREAVASQNLDEGQLEKKCITFEESMGLLLHRAYQHVETLQLTDVPLLIEHCALVLSNCEKLGLQAPTNPKTQETVVIRYFASLCIHAEALNNSELLSKLQEHGLMQLVSRHTLQHAAGYQEEVIAEVLLGFAGLANNEDFQTSWKDFFSEAGSKDVFLGLEGIMEERILMDHPERKKDYRPLMDLFNKVRRI